MENKPYFKDGNLIRPNGESKMTWWIVTETSDAYIAVFGNKEPLPPTPLSMLQLFKKDKVDTTV